MQTFVGNPNFPYTEDHWRAMRLQDDYWTSIRGTDLNASGEMVGRLARVVEEGPSGVKWDRDYFYAAVGETTVHKLIDLFPPGSGWSSVAALSINDNGQILGWGKNPEGESSMFLLTPNAVPEPGTWAVFGLMAAAAGWRARRGGRRLVTPSR
ncbi:PEP-CTERM sorting domain-containing protein [Paludisphaera sp.]|uniref:PEP-CTERM sorting domain-containing protein n=1 Tax=Paludisphaera sp. TaxID=2017432 RepID=UPI00301DD716